MKGRIAGGALVYSTVTGRMCRMCPACQCPITQCECRAAGKQDEAFVALMDAPLAQNVALQRLLAKPSPWHK